MPETLAGPRLSGYEIEEIKAVADLITLQQEAFSEADIQRHPEALGLLGDRVCLLDERWFDGYREDVAERLAYFDAGPAWVPADDGYQLTVKGKFPTGLPLPPHMKKAAAKNRRDRHAPSIQPEAPPPINTPEPSQAAAQTIAPDPATHTGRWMDADDALDDPLSASNGSHIPNGDSVPGNDELFFPLTLERHMTYSALILDILTADDRVAVRGLSAGQLLGVFSNHAALDTVPTPQQFKYIFRGLATYVEPHTGEERHDIPKYKLHPRAEAYWKTRRAKVLQALGNGATLEELIGHNPET